jgi:cysteine desulfurase
MKMPYYFDYQATTPIDPRVVEAMYIELKEGFGNPHSRSHLYGWQAEEKCEIARKQVADLIRADASDIIFTSGATESNNLALLGAFEFYRAKKNHIITVSTEHKCVLDTCRHLEELGVNVTYLPVE